MLIKRQHNSLSIWNIPPTNVWVVPFEGYRYGDCYLNNMTMLEYSKYSIFILIYCLAHYHNMI